jgi:hypothetical protein
MKNDNTDRAPFYGMLAFVFALAAVGGGIAVKAINDMQSTPAISDAAKPPVAPKP